MCVGRGQRQRRQIPIQFHGGQLLADEPQIPKLDDATQAGCRQLTPVRVEPQSGYLRGKGSFQRRPFVACVWIDQAHQTASFGDGEYFAVGGEGENASMVLCASASDKMG